MDVVIGVLTLAELNCEFLQVIFCAIPLPGVTGMLGQRDAHGLGERHERQERARESERERESETKTRISLSVV